MNTANPASDQTELDDCIDCPIRHQAICSRCVDDELLTLDRLKTCRTYAAGEQITYTGQPITHVASLVSGVASVTRKLQDGRHQIMRILLPGDFIGRPDIRFAQ